MGQIDQFLRQLTSLPIRLYQLIISPYLKPCCRFYPSCSEYALTAIRTLGVLKGLKLTCFRLLRCHPWSRGGYDPVIPNKEKL
ncbi:membrane protein insertion efficiency factor YidD [Legionella sp. CNM-4043-24]|uniref:membrane protein insertion efficiency factor YidD n=1 Tax=Legionella sp. CNM-4043-24 TaxID=3421646 RepID=UPI00403AC597